uniref:Ig-like domain-containing protein n=1 Tax=Erpetoichthys calabaricus TaxID=27687 RepID=A0A8C4SAX0_ERPCA
GLALKPVPLKFVKEVKDIVLQEAESIGSSAIFECQISPSTAITSWMKDGSNLRESPKHKFTSDGKDRKLHIIDVQLSDTGEYTCVDKSTAELIITELLAGLTVKAGTKIELPATVKGKPEPKITWTKADLLLKADDRIKIESKPGQSTVTIIGNCVHADAGHYTVTLENKLGSTTGTVNVKVIGK